MNIRTTQRDDIDTFFDIRTSVVENHQSREEIAELGITPEPVAKMLKIDCSAWIAEISKQPIGFWGATSYGTKNDNKPCIYNLTMYINSKNRSKVNKNLP